MIYAILDPDPFVYFRGLDVFLWRQRPESFLVVTEGLIATADARKCSSFFRDTSRLWLEKHAHSFGLLGHGLFLLLDFPLLCAVSC